MDDKLKSAIFAIVAVPALIGGLTGLDIYYRKKHQIIPQYTFIQTDSNDGLTLIAPHNTSAQTSGPVSIYIRTNDTYQHQTKSLDEIVIPSNAIVSIVVDQRDKLAVEYAKKIAPDVPKRAMTEYEQSRLNNLASSLAPIKGSIDAKLGPF